MAPLLLCCGSSSRLTLDWQHEGIRLALVDMIRRAGDPTSRVEKVEHDEADGFKADVRSSQQRICLVTLDLLDAGGGVSGAAYHVDEGEADALMLRLCVSVYIFAAKLQHSNRGATDPPR